MLKKILTLFLFICFVGCSSRYTREDWDKLPVRNITFSSIKISFGWDTAIHQDRGLNGIQLSGKYKYETDTEFQKKLIQSIPIKSIEKAISARYNVKIDSKDLLKIQNEAKIKYENFDYANTVDADIGSKPDNRMELVLWILKSPDTALAEISFYYTVNIYIGGDLVDTVNQTYISETGKIGLYDSDIKKREEESKFFTGKNDFPRFGGITYRMRSSCRVNNPEEDNDKLREYISKICGEYLIKWISTKNNFGS